MSIFLAVSAVPATSAAPAIGQANAPGWVVWTVVGWAVSALIAAIALGAFRRKSIVGPDRLAPTESAWELLIIFVFVYCGGMFAGGVVINTLHLAPGAKLLLVEAAVDLAMFLVALLLLRGIRSGAVALLGLDPRRIVSGICIGATTIFILYPMIQITGELVVKIFERFHLTKAKPHEILQLLGKSRDQRLTIFAVLLACVIAPLAEELLFRGLLQTILVRVFSRMFETKVQSNDELPTFRMENRDGLIPVQYEDVSLPVATTSASVRWAAVIIASAAFAAIHIEPAFLAPLFVLALGLGYVYERTGNLWITITAHALFNSAQILLYFAAGQ